MLAELKMRLSDRRSNFFRAWEVGVSIAIGIEEKAVCHHIDNYQPHLTT